MKTTFTSKIKKGFTLIELLVVIAIMATLAGVGYPIIMGMMEKADISTANKACTDIVAGIESFKNDHSGALPIDTEAFENLNSDVVELTTNGKEDAQLIKVLTNQEDVINEKRTVYLKADTAEGPMEGLFVDGDEIGFYDPWGEPYHVILNLTGEGSLVDPFTNTKVLNKYCLVYSTGVDKLGKHHELSTPAPKNTKKGGKKGKKDSKKKKKDEAESADTLRYPDYTEDEQEQILDNVYSWKKTEE